MEDRRSFRKRERRDARDLHPYWLAAAVSLLTVCGLLGFVHIVRERDEAAFLNATEAVQDSIAVRLEAYVGILLATRSHFISTGGELDLPAFRAFIAGLQMERRYPGTQGVGFSIRLDPSELHTLPTELERQGQAPFRIWPDHARDEYHAIVFLEPLDRRNRAALGYDMFSDPVRREAMARARDTGEAAASGRVTLVQEIDGEKQSGFLIYVPVYAPGARADDVESRRAALRGFVYSPFRADDLMRGIFGTQTEPRVRVDLYDGPEALPGTLMHRSGGSRPRHAGRSALVPIVVAGRPWTLRVEATPAFAAASSGRFLPHLVALAIVVNLALAFATRARVRAQRHEAAAHERLRTLAEVSKRFSEAPLELRLVLETVCREVAQRLTDSCTVNLLDPTGARLELAETHHLDPAAERGVRAVLEQSPVRSGETALGRVAATGEPLLVPRVPLDAYMASVRPEYRHYLEQFPIASLMIVPLRVGERIIGTMTSARGPEAPAYTDDDRRLLQDVADRAALAIENARLAEQLRISTAAADEARRVAEHNAERLRVMVESSPYAVAVFDRELRYLFASGRWLADFHVTLTNEAIRGRCHYELFPELPAAWREVLGRCLGGQSAKSEADLFARPDGQVMWIRWEVHPWRDESGHVGGVLIFSEDISERQNTLAQLRAAVAARDEFLSIASHELRTPLTALTLQLDSLQRVFERGAVDDSALERSKRKVDVSVRQAHRLSTLIDGLLSVSRIATGRLELELEDFDLLAVVRDVLERFEEAASRSGSSLRLRASGSAWGRWDRTRIDQVLTNLLSNAIKYGERKPIDVTVEGTTHGVLVLVRDRGIGVAGEDLPRIFERFERAVSSSHYGGLGLGLYIASEIVRAHGGTIEADSRPGAGATFSVRLPRRVTSVVCPKREGHSPEAPALERVS